MLMLSSSAIGNASRRNLFWPDEVSRPFWFLSPRPSAISENRKRSDGSSRARSAATRDLAFGHQAALWFVDLIFHRGASAETLTVSTALQTSEWAGAICGIGAADALANVEAANHRVSHGRGRNRAEAWREARAQVSARCSLGITDCRWNRRDVLL